MAGKLNLTTHHEKNVDDHQDHSDDVAAHVQIAPHGEQ